MTTTNSTVLNSSETFPIMYRQLLVFVALLAQVIAYNTYKGVLIADDTNFEGLIHEKGKYTFINFYSTQCVHCSNLGPKFQLLTELFNNTNVQIAQLEGRENKRIRKKLTIAGFPTLRLYAFDGTHLASYNGDRATEDMADFIQSHTGITPNWPNLQVGELTTEKELISKVKYSKNEDVVVCFTAPWLEGWIGRYSIVEKLAKKLTDIDFYKVDATNEETSDLTSLYKVDKYPTIIHFKKSNGLTKNFRVLENTKFIDEETFHKFLGNEIGENYDSLKDLETSKGRAAEQEEQLKKGFNFGLQRELSPEQEEESYKQLREL